MDDLALVLMLAVTVEALVEYAKSAVQMVVDRTIRCFVIRLAAIAVSVGLCLLAGADLYAVLGVTFRWQPVGCVLTGVFAARGANYVSDLVSALGTALGAAGK